MILDLDIIPFTTNVFKVYKSDDEYFLINGNDDFLIDFDLDDLEEVEERFGYFYSENQASCHHLTGEFRIDSKNYASVVGNFYGFDYYTENEIKEVLNKLITLIEKQSKSLQQVEIKVATFYDLDSLEDIEPDEYQVREFSIVDLGV